MQTERAKTPAKAGPAPRRILTSADGGAALGLSKTPPMNGCRFLRWVAGHAASALATADLPSTDNPPLPDNGAGSSAIPPPPPPPPPPAATTAP